MSRDLKNPKEPLRNAKCIPDTPLRNLKNSKELQGALGYVYLYPKQLLSKEPLWHP